MSLLFMEGFHDLNSDGDFVAAYPSGPNFVPSSDDLVVTINGGPFGTGDILIERGAADAFTVPVSPAGNTIFIQGYLNFDSTDLHDNAAMLIVGDSPVAPTNTSNHVIVRINTTTGMLEARRGGSGGTVIATSTIAPPRSSTAWNLVEAKIVVDGSAGEVYVRINDIVYLNATGLNTDAGSGVISQAGIGSCVNYTNGGNKWDDVIIMDDAGTKFNGLIGPHRIYKIAPVSVGGDNSWTATSAANKANDVDSPGLGSSEGYIYSSVEGDRQEFKCQQLSGVTSAMIAVRPTLYARMSGVDAVKVRGFVSTGTSTSYITVGAGLTGTYSMRSEIFESAPDGSAWTPALVSASRCGVAVVTAQYG